MGRKEHAVRKYASGQSLLRRDLCTDQRRLVDEFAELIGHDSTVSTLDAIEFDPRGQYKDVLQAVEKGGNCKSRVYRVEHGKTRIEYYVVGLDKDNMRVVGLRAKAVES